MTASASQSAWFDYPLTVQPHHTDYAGVVWHGSYLTWMEEARVVALQSAGVEFSDLVNLGCDLPVIHLSLSYRQSLKLGDRARVRTRLDRVEKVRFLWTQNITPLDSDLCFVAGQITLVAVDRNHRRILRRFPPQLQTAIAYLAHPAC